MNKKIPTCKQLERDLSQSIRAFYVDEIKFSPQKITCKLFSKYLIIIAEEAMTPLEKSLWETGKEELTKQLRSEINSIFKPKLIQVIEDIIGVKVEEVISTVTFTSNKSGTVIILSEPPQIREFKPVPKPKLGSG